CCSEIQPVSASALAATSSPARRPRRLTISATAGESSTSTSSGCALSCLSNIRSSWFPRSPRGAKRGQAPLPERPAGCYAQRCLTPFRTTGCNPWCEKGSGTFAGTARRVLRTKVPDPFSHHGLQSVGLVIRSLLQRQHHHGFPRAAGPRRLGGTR